VRPLAQWLASLLYPLIAKYVTEHVDSTSQFVQLLSDKTVETNCCFCSLDVINLYGNIPLEDDTSTGIRGLITVVNDFFTNFQHLKNRLYAANQMVSL
jgi:hypothetical protein